MIDTKKYFTTRLLRWNIADNDRPMPWKGEKDPYKIWLSEVILQQTRVLQGWDYYNRFVNAFPTIQHLAKAPETKVFKLWEGLGYYTRCKNLIATAKFIVETHRGKFPHYYEEILRLKGVGPYTAAAIGSFAFDLPYAVVDGNVFRVLSRYFGIIKAIDSTEGKKLFTRLANELLDKKIPGIYNQALMDLGAVVCKPQLPLCTICPLKSKCIAHLKGMTGILPVKEKTILKKKRWFYYVMAEYNGTVYVRKRSSKDIWQNLFEFILTETPAAISAKQLKDIPLVNVSSAKKDLEIKHISNIHRQQLTHQLIQGQFIHVLLKRPVQLKGYKTVTNRQLQKLPFPKFITGYLAENR